MIYNLMTHYYSNSSKSASVLLLTFDNRYIPKTKNYNGT